MRDRPFISAGDPPRPFSEIRTERDGSDLHKLTVHRTLTQIALLEGQAFAVDQNNELIVSPEERKRLLCEAEALRCCIDELRRP